MVSLLVLNPAHKLRFLSKLILKGSKRILREIDTSSTHRCTPPLAEDVNPTKRRKINAQQLVKLDLNWVPNEGLTLDAEYYRHDSESGLCEFRVENTLFKVHKCYLVREPSVFGDMFALPFVGEMSDTTPILLYDTAEQFRDLLWALYALPTQLASTAEEDCPSIERLLNIARLANKYCMSSYEAWALQRIFTLAQNHLGFLRTAPSELCARALDIAFLCNHRELLDMITQRLVARILWTDVDRRPILDVAESRGLRRLQGVAYYKELVTLERNPAYDGSSTGKAPLVFPPSTSPEKRARLLAAHRSLLRLAEWVRSSPPAFADIGCTAHTECLAAWSDMWGAAGAAGQTMRLAPVDVLGRLKTMMILLRKWMLDANSPVSIDCSLAALEAITMMREEIVEGLMDHFEGRG